MVSTHKLKIQPYKISRFLQNLMNVLLILFLRKYILITSRELRQLQSAATISAVIPWNKQPLLQYYCNFCHHYGGITAAVGSSTAVFSSSSLPCSSLIHMCTALIISQPFPVILHNLATYHVCLSICIRVQCHKQVKHQEISTNRTFVCHNAVVCA